MEDKSLFFGPGLVPLPTNTCSQNNNPLFRWALVLPKFLYPALYMFSPGLNLGWDGILILIVKQKPNVGIM